MQFDLNVYDATLIPAIIFMLWVVGQLGFPRKLLPVLAVVLSIISSLVFVSFSAEGVLTGILLAAAVVGVHSGTKNVFEFSSTESGQAARKKQVSSNYLDDEG